MLCKDIEKECELLSKRQSWVVKAFEDTFEKLRDEISESDIDTIIHARFSAFEINPEYPYDDDGEFGNYYTLQLSKEGLDLVLYNTVQSNIAENFDCDAEYDSDLPNLNPENARIMLEEFPSRLNKLLGQLKKENQKYESVENIVNKFNSL